MVFRMVHRRLQDVPREGLAAVEIASMHALATQTVALARTREPRFRLLAAASDPASMMNDKSSDQLVGDPAERQRLFAALDLRERLTASASNERARLEAER